MAIIHTRWAKPAPKKKEVKKPEKKVVKEKPIVKEVPIIAEPSIEELLNNENI